MTLSGSLGREMGRQFSHGGIDVAVGNGGPASGGSGPVERIQIARPALPCDRCTHRVVCSIKPRLEAAAIELKAPAAPDPNVTITVSVELTCAFFVDDGSPIATPPTRIATDLRDKGRRGAAASKAARKPAGPPPAGNVATRAVTPQGELIRKGWTPEARARQSERIRASIAAKRAGATEPA